MPSMLNIFSLLFLAQASFASLLEGHLANRQYLITNNCPTSINLYVAGVLDSVIPKTLTISRFDSTGASFFYSDANGGNVNGIGTTRVGFFPPDFYYIVQHPHHINTGVKVRAINRIAANGFCPTIECDSIGCFEGFPQPPTAFPFPAGLPPPIPYYRCLGNPVQTIFELTFCPQGSFPIQGNEIHPNSNPNKCLDVRGAVFENGTPVQIYDCNGTPAQRWFISPGSTIVQLAGTNFCLDAGSSPADGVGLKIWECFNQLPAQEWFYTADNRIALEGKGFCTDLTNGDLTNGNVVQTWTCSNNNVNQIWTINPSKLKSPPSFEAPQNQEVLG